ncbi:DUF6119 family protein [Chitinophaga solisilvae]|uniref:DUF6119 family protein n=1 Tax=Chitinophaga solisilvae TaxID=1233460 RepID=UPI00136F0BD9|nr:DUF6119 family protein [Chitinophaga solisilvae]
MADTEKIVISYNQIDDAFIKERDFHIVVGDMIRIINASGTKKYTEQQANAKNFAPYHILTYYADPPLRDPKWKDFIGEFVDATAPIAMCKIIAPSFILFVGYKKRMFAITGGAGSFAIQGFVSQSFGMDILTRLINETTPAIKLIQNRGVIGTVLAQVKQFRKDRRLMDENEFGKIYKEVKADLDKVILTKVFGFKDIDLRRNVSGCLAKSSFKLNIRVDPKGFLAVIRRLNALLNKPPNFIINNVELISKKKSSSIKKLQDALIGTVYNNFCNGEELDFDFCHPEIEKYFNATYYELPQTALSDLTVPPILQILLVDLQKDGILKVGNIEEFKKSVMRINMNSYDEEGHLLTSGSLWEHLHGEISLDGQIYFYIDGDWYRIKPNFIKQLNRELKQFLDEHWDDKLLTTPFDLSKDEGKFNAGFIGTPGMLVFDKIIPDNIEPCDLLKYRPGVINLIHVKKGFNNMIRDLAAQVSIAASRIEHDKNAGYKYINQIESIIKASVTSDSRERQKLGGQEFPPGGLEKLFRDTRTNNTCFCLAFVDTAKSERSLRDNLNAFDSNIAKYSLLTLIKEIVGMGFDFKVIQLNRVKKKSR